jgi:hypothetical protein
MLAQEYGSEKEAETMNQLMDSNDNWMRDVSSSQRSKTMRHTLILKKAWRNVVSYRGLWILGILLALTTFSGKGAYLVGQRDQHEFSGEGITVEPRDDETFWQALERTMETEFADVDRDLERFFATEFGIGMNSRVGTYLTILIGAALVLYIAGRVARYVSETALIHMVDRHEGSGERLSVRQGLRLGWSRAAWRLFLIDLVITIAAAAAGIVLFGLVLSPVALWINGGETAVIVGGLLTASLLLLAIFVVIIFAGLVTLVRMMARRACALEGLTVTGSIRRGYAMVRTSLKDVILMGLATAGINGIWPAVIGTAALLLLSAGLAIGALPVVILAGLSDPATLPAAILGGAFFILVMVAPLVFLEGLLRVFFSSVWTLAYRQLRDLETTTEEAAPASPVPDTPLPVPSA